MSSVSSSQMQVRSGAYSNQPFLSSHGHELAEPRLSLNLKSNCKSWLESADGAQADI